MPQSKSQLKSPIKSVVKSINIEVEVKSKRWLEINDIEKFIKSQSVKLIELSPLKKYLKNGSLFEASISLCSNTQIKKINQQFRNIDKPTNVLSFANLDEKIIQKHGLKNAIGKAKYIFLGDIILGFEYIKNEAKNNNKKFNEHLTHLVIHGILHLIGYDHEDLKMASVMENLEIKILKQLGINNPYSK
ncbi:MAG: rRNA maturation RNase YbeY [Alphaproteobacteria bacterium]|nr:rRNA maturation RNase YbeY [Alphaproteobacteria bacterium]